VEIITGSIQQDTAKILGPFVADKTHHISIASNPSAGSTEPVAAKALVLPSGARLSPILAPNTKGLTDAQRLQVEKALVTASNGVLPIIKANFPGVSGSIEGIELVLATKTAFDAWSDPQRKSVVKPLFKTTRAMFELLDILKQAMPNLKQVPYVDAIGAVVKVGDSLFQFYADYSEVMSPTAK
jgi:hypothetical protein